MINALNFIIPFSSADILLILKIVTEEIFSYGFIEQQPIFKI